MIRFSYLFFLLTLISCLPQAGVFVTDAKDVIRGTILDSNLAFAINGECSQHVRLVSFKSPEEEIARGEILPNREYEIFLPTSYQLTAFVDHYLEVESSEGCVNASYLARPLTDIKNSQNITTFSTLLFFTNSVSNSNKLQDILKTTVERMLTEATGEEFNKAYNKLVLQESSFQNIFGIRPEDIKLIAPIVKRDSFPQYFIEGANQEIRSTAIHWDNSYPLAYEWLVDDVKVSSSNNWTPVFPYNSSGAKNIVFRVGRDNGGDIDNSLPYYQVNKMIMVNNTVLPIAPDFSLFDMTVDFDKLNLKLSTGGLGEHCSSFTSFAITFNHDSPVTFDYECNTYPEQVIRLSHSLNDGNHTVKIYSIDDAGEVSTAKTQSFVIDRTPPMITVPNISPLLRGGSKFDLTYEVSDLSLIVEQRIQVISNGVITYESNLGPSPFNLLIPSIEADNAIIRIIAIDSFGHESVKDTHSFVIDSIAPSAPVLVSSGLAQNGPIVSLSIADCQESEISISVNSSIYEWRSCSTLMIFDSGIQSSSDKEFFVSLKDNAGNISETSKFNIQFDYDAPVITPSFREGVFVNKLNLNVYLKSCSDISEYSVSSSNVFTSWESCENDFPVSLPNGIEKGAFYVKARDIAGNESVIHELSYTYDNTSPTFSEIVINPNDEGVGANYAKTAFVSILISYEENNADSAVAFKMADAVNGNCLAPEEGMDWRKSASVGVIKERFSFQLTSGDGQKKICAYLKDAAGNLTVSSGNEIENVNFDTIHFEIGNIPVFKFLSIVSDSNTVGADEILSLSWEVSDIEGLELNPMHFEYTTDNFNWYPLLDESNRPLLSYGNLTSHLTFYQGTVNFKAPSSTYFRVRGRATDMAGNESLAALSETLNTTPWNVFSGSIGNGLGTKPLTTTFTHAPNYGFSMFTFDPTNGDMYIKANNEGIWRVNSATGLTEEFIKYGTSAHLPDDGIINNTHRVTNLFVMDFGRDGNLYLLSAFSQNAGKLYKINTRTRHAEWIAGGGNDYTNLLDPKTLNIHYGLLSLDEDDTPYVSVMCQTGRSYNALSSDVKIVKLGKTIEHVAGNCSRSTLTAGSDAKLSGLGIIQHPQMGSMAVKDRGVNLVISRSGSSALMKVNNGKIFNSGIASGAAGLRFSKDGHLYVSLNGIKKVKINESGVDEVIENIIKSDYSVPNCHLEFIPVNEACAVGPSIPGFTPSGQVVFTDGPFINAPKQARIRTINDDGLVVTLAGTKSLYGEGLDKSVLRGNLVSLHYQNSSVANTHFPEGLYFGSAEEAALFRIDESGVIHRHIGNGLGISQFEILEDVVLNSTQSFITLYMSGHTGGIWAFNNGYPYFRQGGHIYRVNDQMQAKGMMMGNVWWDELSTSQSPLSASVYAMDLLHNIVFKNDGIFLAGAAYFNPANSKTSGNNSASLRYFDFGNDKIVHILGGNGSNLRSPDVVAPTDLSDLNLNSGYTEKIGNFMAYDQHLDRLFIVEENKYIREISAPDSNLSTLKTIYTTNGGSLGNMTLHPEGHSLIFLKSGLLYCLPLNENSPEYCDPNIKLGPSDGLGTIIGRANQFTWKNNEVLFINSGAMILELNLSMINISAQN